MINLPNKKLYNTYLIETPNIKLAITTIENLAIMSGFDRKLVESHNHPDINYIESMDKTFAIDIIRNEVVENCALTPKVGDRKFYLIYDAVHLDKKLQNTLLKTLEEPPDYVSIFLISTNINKLLDTVKSRAIIIKDTEIEDYKPLLDVDFFDEALSIMANIKYSNEYDIMNFAENFSGNEEKFKALIKIYRYVLRDAFAYKQTLTKKIINIKEKEDYIVMIANALSVSDIGQYIDKLDVLTSYKGLQIDKKLAVYSFFR